MMKFNKSLILMLCFIACLSLVNAEGIDSDTVLMLHMDDTGLTDSSDSSHAITLNGDAALNTGTYKFSPGSAYLDGIGDYLSIPDSNDWAFGTGDFTVDFWVRFNSLSGGENNGNPTFMHQFYDTNNRNGIAIWAGNLYMLFRDGGIDKGYYQIPWTPLTNTWYHLALKDIFL